MQPNKPYLPTICLAALFSGLAACQLEKAAEAEKDARQTAKDFAITLSWEGVDDGSIVSYNVYVAKTEKETGSLLDTIDATAAPFEASAPKIVLNSKDEATLAEFKGAHACFSLAAVDQDANESERSPPVCGDL